MPEERKPTPPLNPRPARLGLPAVRPLVPVRSQTPLTANNINRLEIQVTRSIRRQLKPASALPRVADVQRKSLIPTPPATTRSAARTRPVSSSCVVPSQAKKSRCLAIVGKPVQKKEGKQYREQAQKSSSQKNEGVIAETAKASEEAKKVAANKVDLKKGLLFNHEIPLSLEFFKKKGFKIPPSRSFQALSNGSHIPVLTKNLKSRATKQSEKPAHPNETKPKPTEIKDDVPPRPSGATINSNISNQLSDEKPNEIKVVDVPTIDSEAQSPDASPRDITKLEERPSHTSKMDPPFLRPIMQRHLEPLYLPGPSGVDHFNNYEELSVVEKDPNTFGRFPSKLQREHQNMMQLGEILPTRFIPDRKFAELEGLIPDQEGEPQVPLNQVAVKAIVKEFEKVKDHLQDVKIRSCSKTKENTTSDRKNIDQADSEQQILDSDPITYVKIMANNMNAMVNDIDLDMECVQRAAKEIVESMVERLKASKEKFEGTLLKHEKEILRLQGKINELQYSVVEGEAKFNSLEKAMDRTNEEYENLEKRNAELLEENKRLEAELEKINEDLVFRAKELGSNDLLEENKRLSAEIEKFKQNEIFRARELTNLHLNIQRRDTRSSELLDEYHVLWRERNCMSVQVAALEAELKQGEYSIMSLHEHNSTLGRQIAALEDQIRELQHRNSFLTGGASPVEFHESEELTKNANDTDTNKMDEVSDSQQNEDTAASIGIKEHVLFVEDGKIINGLAESSKKVPTAAVDALAKYHDNTPSEIITRDGKRIQRYQAADKKSSPNQVNKTASLLNMMSEKIQTFGKKNTEVEKGDETLEHTTAAMEDESFHFGGGNVMAQDNCEYQADMAATVQQEIKDDDLHLEKREDIMPQEECLEQNNEVTSTQHEMIDDARQENKSTGVTQELCEKHTDQVAAVEQEMPDNHPALAVEITYLAQENSEEQIDRTPSVQVQANLDLPHESTYASTVLSREVQTSKMGFQDLVNQIDELQSTIEILREKNAQLEDEKVEMITERQGFLLENMREVKKLQEMEESLKEKERMFNFKVNNGINATNEMNDDQETDWYSECVKACQRVHQMEDCMRRQDGLLKELETDKERLLEDNRNLRIEIATMSVEDVSFAGLPKTLQGLEDIVKEIRRSKVFCNGVRKRIRCFTKCDVAIQELRRMDQNTLVISVGDINLSEEEKQAQTPPPMTQEDFLIKMPKLIKKHRMKNSQSRLFLNKNMNTNLVNPALPGFGGSLFFGSIRRHHKRKNPSILLRLSRNLARINEERLEDIIWQEAGKEIMAETDKKRLDERFDERFEGVEESKALSIVEETDKEEVVDGSVVAVGESVVVNKVEHNLTPIANAIVNVPDVIREEDTVQESDAEQDTVKATVDDQLNVTLNAKSFVAVSEVSEEGTVKEDNAVDASVQDTVEAEKESPSDATEVMRQTP